MGSCSHFLAHDYCTAIYVYVCMCVGIWPMGLACGKMRNAHICLPSRLKIRFLAPIFRAKMSFASLVYVLLLYNTVCLCKINRIRTVYCIVQCANCTVVATENRR